MKMKTMKLWRIAFMMLAAFSIAGSVKYELLCVVSQRKVEHV
jgi:hypothetical protein